MWTFEQATGDLFDEDGELRATGYSGFADGKNNPAWQQQPDLGPIPCGDYTIGAPRDLEGGPHGPFVLALTPDPANAMYGRDGFECHGDGLGSHFGHASHGCVILPRPIREQIATSGDNRLRVVSGL